VSRLTVRGPAVFFKTKNQKLWELKEFSNDFVSLSPDAAEALVDLGVKLVGIDYKSIESFYAGEYPVHKALLGNGIFIVEGLYLNEVPPGRYDLYCFPLRLDDADGGPARILLARIP
jgi:arylformamidase